MLKKKKDYSPRNDVQQTEFLQKYPEYDGRGILIAVIDSGVDVSLPEMQKTSTGLPKIVDCFNFNQSEKVDTSKIKKLENDIIWFGISGRKLKEKLKEAFVEKIFKKYNIEIDEEKLVAELVPKNLLIDCIVWFDGEKWQACLIPFYCDDLENDVKVLTNFRDEHEFSFFLDHITYCIKIEDEGNSLEIFSPWNFHGTGVAPVAVAHFPDNPKQDGIAPGAQIISLDICRNGMRIDAYKNAFLKCIEMGVDIINVSGATSTYEERKMLDLFNEIVYKHGIIVVFGAGNSGPIFSSIEEEIDPFFVIGAVDTVEIKKNIFGMQINEDEDDATVSFTSSRGPLPSGARGITFVAPKFAKTSTPKWCSLGQNILISGTSISTPIVAGSIACLLSALKTNSIKYSPATIKLALSNTAKLPKNGDKLGFGDGIIQIKSAFEFLQKYSSIIRPTKLLPKIKIMNPSKFFDSYENKNGIVLVQTKNTPLNYCFVVKVKNVSQTKSISWILKSSLNSNHDLELQHSKTVENNIFYVKIDVSKVKEGSIIYSEISGIHPIHSSIGPIFHLPITVIIPEEANFLNERKTSLKAFEPFSLCLDPPEESKKCFLIIETTFEDGKTPILIQKNFVHGLKNDVIEIHDHWIIRCRWENIFVFSAISISKNYDILYEFKIQIKFEN